MENNNYQLPLHNPWWDESYKIDRDVKLLELSKQKFVYEHPLLKEFPIQQSVVLILRGPRRIGKTTLMKQIIKRLIDNNIPGGNILFFPCDMITNFDELYIILKGYIENIRVETKKHLYLFIDEISFVNEWQRAIKSLADSNLLNNVTVLITGSNSIDLKILSERLPGRTGKYFNIDKLFLPLTFKEFYKLLNKEWDSKFHYDEIPRYKKYFDDYLLIGGFPNVINEYYTTKNISPGTYETYTKWIDGDIYKVQKSPDNAYRLFNELNKSVSSRISYTSFAQNTGFASQKTVQEYLDIFKMMFVIFECEYFSLDQKKVNPKKNKKLYFADPFIHNAVIAKENGFLDDAFNYSKKVLLRDKFLENRFEEAIGSNLKRNYDKFFYGCYSAKDLEIDFVGFKKGRYDLFEAKYGNNLDLKSYEEFLNKQKSYKKITIITKDLEKTGMKVSVEPFYKALF